MQMLCPKCQNLMKQYERNGVVVDQCSECRGIFLDRGELEHLLDAEEAFLSRSAAAPPPPPPPSRPAYDPRYDDRRYDDRRHYDDRDGYDRRRDDKYYKKKKRKSMFEELFDF
ncbi:hypothetical protein GCM10029992_19720 [Glycomyces albus]